MLYFEIQTMCLCLCLLMKPFILSTWNDLEGMSIKVTRTHTSITMATVYYNYYVRCACRRQWVTCCRDTTGRNLLVNTSIKRRYRRCQGNSAWNDQWTHSWSGRRQHAVTFHTSIRNYITPNLVERLANYGGYCLLTISAKYYISCRL